MDSDYKPNDDHQIETDDKNYDAFVVSIFFILFSFWFTHFFFILTFHTAVGQQPGYFSNFRVSKSVYSD